MWAPSGSGPFASRRRKRAGGPCGGTPIVTSRARAARPEGCCRRRARTRGQDDPRRQRDETQGARRREPRRIEKRLREGRPDADLIGEKLRDRRPLRVGKEPARLKSSAEIGTQV